MRTHAAPIAATPTGKRRSLPKTSHFVVYLDGEGTEPSQELNGREALTPVFADLNRYAATTHFNGQSTGAGTPSLSVHCLNPCYLRTIRGRLARRPAGRNRLFCRHFLRPLRHGATACHAEGRGFESLQPLPKRPSFPGLFRLGSRLVRLRRRTIIGQWRPSQPCERPWGGDDVQAFLVATRTADLLQARRMPDVRFSGAYLRAAAPMSNDGILGADPRPSACTDCLFSV
jgi:hypothetical protein